MKPIKTPYKQETAKKERGEVRLGDILEWIDHPNLAETMDEDELLQIGNDVVKAYEFDLKTSEEKRKRVEKAEKLARLQSLKVDKTFPWVGSADTVHPLTSEVIIHYFSRVFPAFVKDQNVAKFRVIGKDPEGIKAAKAERLGQALSYFILEKLEGWLDSIIQCFMQQPCSGSAFKKIYYDPSIDNIVSETMPFQDFVADYFTKSLQDSDRHSHVFSKYPHQVESEIRAGNWLDFEFGEGDAQRDEESGGATDSQQAASSREDSPHLFIEQHCYLDLDEDGLVEPYIVTVHNQSAKVVRIKAAFDLDTIEIRNPDSKEKRFTTLLLSDYLSANPDTGKGTKFFLVRIKRQDYFVQIKFLPSPDGGFYGMGLGEIAAALNEIINDSTNQLMDSATLSNIRQGFITRDIQTPDRDGKITFSPQKPWVRVEVNNIDIRNCLYEFQRHEPSPTLFSLRNALIEDGKEWLGNVNVTSGQMPSGNAAYGTVVSLLQQAMQKTAAVTKLTWLGIQAELRLIWKLVQKYRPHGFTYLDNAGLSQELSEEDMDNDGMLDVIPVADPEDLNDFQKMLKSDILMKFMEPIAQAGGNATEAVRRSLDALNIPDTEKILPKDARPPVSPEIMKMQLDMSASAMELNARAHEYEIRRMEIWNQTIQTGVEMHKTRAEIQKIQADAIKAIADAEALESGDQISEYSAKLEAANTQAQEFESVEEQYRQQVAYLSEMLEMTKGANQNGITGQSQNESVQSGSLGSMESQPANPGVFSGIAGVNSGGASESGQQSSPVAG